jgi:CBS domain-containing protein
MTSIKDVLEKKGYDIWSISPHATVGEALRLLAERNVGALVVLEAGKLAGIISERDYARHVAVRDDTSLQTLVSEIMTEDVVTIRPDEDIDRAMNIMTNRHFRHLPVVDDSELIGVISIGDVVKNIIAEQEALIDDLEDYITGRR